MWIIGELINVFQLAKITIIGLWMVQLAELPIQVKILPIPLFHAVNYKRLVQLSTNKMDKH